MPGQSQRYEEVVPHHIAWMDRRQRLGAFHAGEIDPSGVQIFAGNQLSRRHVPAPRRDGLPMIISVVDHRRIGRPFRPCRL